MEASILPALTQISGYLITAKDFRLQIGTFEVSAVLAVCYKQMWVLSVNRG